MQSDESHRQIERTVNDSDRTPQRRNATSHQYETLHAAQQA